MSVTSSSPRPPGEPSADPNVVYSKHIPLSGSSPPTRPPAGPAKGVWLAVASVILGALGCVLPLTPFNLDGVRTYIALPFAVPGLAAGILGLTGGRRGKAVAIVGTVLCGIAVALSAVMFRVLL